MNPTNQTKPERLAPATSAESGKTVDAVRAQYENSPEYRLGCEIIDEMTETLGVGADEVAAMLGSNTRPTANSVIGAQAASILTRMEGNGQLARGMEDYLSDETFIALLREVPAQIAVRLSDAELAAKTADARAQGARGLGMQDALEKLRARRALPQQTRVKATASAEPDFSGMSAEEFNGFKRRYFSHR